MKLKWDVCKSYVSLQLCMGIKHGDCRKMRGTLHRTQREIHSDRDV